MSKKRRTKKQKVKAKHKFNLEPVGSVSDSASSVEPVVSSKPQLQDRNKSESSEKSSIEELGLFRYDRKLIYKDLLKSLLFTIFIFGLLLAIYFWLK